VSHRIDRLFEQLACRRRTALVPFVTAGDPDPEWMVDIMHSLVGAGADMLELGFPFSDPTADGPVIQASSERAIDRGVTLKTVLDMVRSFRESDTRTPVVLMGYLNPLERYGHERFANDAAEAGVDGLLLVDCPPEEMKPWRAVLDDRGLYSICLVAPTTTAERRRRIVENARGFVYYVSFKGITGADSLSVDGLEEAVAGIRAVTDLPLAVGFGIKDAATAAAVAGVADAVVIGSALVSRLASAGSREEAVAEAGSFLAPIAAAMDNPQVTSN
jgi:tryptophan synthase alpha chain